MMYLVDKKEKILSNWVTLVTRTVESPLYPGPMVYHSIKQSDYISILSITKDQQIPLVKQYRPALEGYTIELPGGLLDHEGEEPLEAAIRELYEETGYRATRENCFLLGKLAPDSGRLDNVLWAYMAVDVTPSQNWTPENTVSPVIKTKQEFIADIQSGHFNNALHIALVGLATLQNRF